MMKVMIATLFCAGIAATAAAQDAKVAAGEKVYEAQKCQMCHSIGDKGNKKGPLDGVGTKLKAEEMREWITDGPGMTAKTKAPRKPSMKAYTIPKDDLDSLVAYLGSLKK